MRRLRLVFMSVLLGAAVLFPIPAHADPNNPCFASDNGAGVEDESAHYGWAVSRSADTVANNLSGKVAMVFNCSSVSDSQLTAAFGQISSVIAQQGLPVSCFNGDQGVLNTDAAGHESWARARSRNQVRDNLAWKSGAAIRCLGSPESRASLFAKESVMLARVPGSAPSVPPAAGLTCGQWGVQPNTPIRAGQLFSMNWAAPANHSGYAWIGIARDGEPSDNGAQTAWEYLKNDAGTCGKRDFEKTVPTPGVWVAYIYANNGYSAIAGPVRFVVDP
jgi:hypothetical protein